MSWGKVDDRFPEHPKWTRLEREHGAAAWAPAMAVWVASLCYANRNETDGEVAEVVLARLTPLGRAAIKAAEHLVAVGLFERTEAGFRLHDFERYNPTRATKEAERAADRERKAAGKAGGRPKGTASESGKTPEGIRAESERTPKPPSRPDPTLPRSDQPEGGDLDQVARANPPAPAPPAESLTGDAEAVRRMLVEGFASIALEPPPELRTLAARDGSNVVEVARWVRAQATREGRPFGDVLLEVARGFFASSRARARRFPLGWLAKSPAEYLGGRAAPSPMYRPTTDDELEALGIAPADPKGDPKP